MAATSWQCAMAQLQALGLPSLAEMSMPPDSSAREGELKKLVSGLSLAAGCRERSGQRAVCHSPRVNAVLCFCPRQARPPRAPGARGIKKRKLVAGLIPCLLAVCLGTARASPPEVVSFKGICDASAAIALDATRIIVGDDEKPWLSIYGLDGGDRQSKIALPHHAGGARPILKAPPFSVIASSGFRPTAGTSMATPRLSGSNSLLRIG